MFETLGSFSLFFWSVGGLLLLGIVFEEKFIALEDKIDAKRAKKKTTIKAVQKTEDRRTAKSA